MTPNAWYTINEINEKFGGPLEYIGHYLIGANPDDLECGYWATELEAVANFAAEFSTLAQKAQGHFLFVRAAPVCRKESTFEGEDKWRMIGRFSIAKIKEKNT